MTKLAKIREWKERWGYDDMAVMPGGRPMKHFAPDRKRLDGLAKLMGEEGHTEASELLMARLENPAAQRLRLLAKSLEELLPEEPTEEQAKLPLKLQSEIERIRLTEDTPDPALIQALADAIRENAADEASSLEEWKDDLAHPYDPAQGPLATSIADRIRGREILDRSAAIDQVTGKIYSDDRREELSALTGNHYLAKAFGLRAIREETTNGQLRSGILFSHGSSSKYQRDDLNTEVSKSMVQLYKNVRPKLPAYAASKVFFVNNAKVADKLTKTYGPTWVDPQNPSLSYKALYDKTVEIKPGLHAILMTGTVAQTFKTRLLEGSGCTPSAYQVEKVKDPSAAIDPLTASTMRDKSLPPNDGRLAAIAASPGCKRLGALPEGAPLKQAALAASNMVTGLETALAKLKDGPKWAAVKDNKLVANALQKIERLMETMPTYTEDVPRFSRLFDLLVDEVYLVLATCKPYGKDDFRKASGDMIEERIPTLKQDDMAEVKHSTAMLSSGMDGLSTAVAAAFTLTGSSKLKLIDGGGDHSSNYFEVEANLLGEGVKGTPVVGGPGYTPPVIMGSLNPSTPVKQAKGATVGKGDKSWSVADLIGKINEVLAAHMHLLTDTKPAVAIIDVTVERNASGADQEMDKLVADPTIKKALQEGKLTLMLAKSYQKYPSLGAGKAMAAGLTVIGKGIAADKEPLKTVADAEGAQGLLADPSRGGALPGGYDESQILTHFMTHERGAERTMMERAAKNASFVRSFMPKDSEVKSNLVRFDEGLPFIVLPKDGLGVAKKPSGVKQTNVSTTLMQQGVEERMSFGFQNSSCLTTTGGMMRIGLGQESEEDLVEKLYAVTNLAAKPVPGGINPDKTIAMAGKAANAAMKQAKAALAIRTDGDQAWRERMVRVLSDAGLLSLSAEVKRDKAGLIVEPADDELKRRLAAVTDDTSETDLGKLGTKLALAAALRPKKAADPALALSMEKTPADDEGRGKWITKVESALQSRGVALAKKPAKDPKDQKYIEALRGALHDADDANLIHAHTAKTFEGPGATELGTEAKFLPNIVASCANLISTTLQAPDKFIALSDVVIKNGLEDLSPEGQERLLRRRVQASFALSGAKVKADLDSIGQVAEQMPYREGLANLIKGKDLLASVNKPRPDDMDDDTVKGVVDKLSGPLDLSTQCDLFEQLVAGIADPGTLRIAKQYKPVLQGRFDHLALAYVPREPLKELEESEPTPKLPPQVDPPLVARDIRRGASGVDTHGPQAMSKVDFEKLKLRFETVAKKVI